MQHASPAIVLLLPLLFVASCRAADKGRSTTAPAPPTSAPAGLTASATVAHTDAGWVAQVTLNNATNHPLATGRYTGFTLTRVDTQPPQAVKTSPPAMAPHFRVQLPAGESTQASVSVWYGPNPLPPGRYHVAVTYPGDVLAIPVEADFTVPAASTQKP